MFRIPSECFTISDVDWKSREPRTVWYGMPVEAKYGETAITRCVVKAFRQDGGTVGYLALPRRYAAAWTQLCYTIVYWLSIWQGWTREAGRKRRVRNQLAHDVLVLCINNSAARLGKYLSIRRLIIEELLQHTFSEDGKDQLDVFDEYLIRDRFDWLWTKRAEVPKKDVKYLSLDPVHSSNRGVFGSKASSLRFSWVTNAQNLPSVGALETECSRRDVCASAFARPYLDSWCHQPLRLWQVFRLHP